MEAVVPISVVASSATMTITYPALARSRVVALILASLLSSLWWKSPPTDRYRLNGMSLGEGDRSEQLGSPSPTPAWAGRKPAANGYGTPTDYESGFWECADRNCWSGASLEHHRCHALPPGLHAACGSFRGLQGKHPREIRRLPARPNLQTFGSQRSACRPAQSTVRRRAATSGGPGSANPIQRTIAAGIEILTPSLASSPWPLVGAQPSSTSPYSDVPTGIRAIRLSIWPGMTIDPPPFEPYVPVRTPREGPVGPQCWEVSAWIELHPFGDPPLR